MIFFLRPARKIVEFLDHFEPIVDEFNRLLSGNKIFIERLAGVAVVTKEEAFSYNLVGPNLRGSGVKVGYSSRYPLLDLS